MEMDINGLLSKIATYYDSSMSESFTGNIQVELTGEKSGNWYLAFQNGQCNVIEGNAEEPTLSLSCDSADFNDLLQGTLDPTKAYMSGKLKITGNILVVMKLASMLKSKKV
jgi:putative sterol carrier protein